MAQWQRHHLLLHTYNTYCNSTGRKLTAINHTERQRVRRCTLQMLIWVRAFSTVVTLVLLFSYSQWYVVFYRTFSTYEYETMVMMETFSVTHIVRDVHICCCEIYWFRPRRWPQCSLQIVNILLRSPWNRLFSECHGKDSSHCYALSTIIITPSALLRAVSLVTLALSSKSIPVAPPLENRRTEKLSAFHVTSFIAITAEIYNGPCSVVFGSSIVWHDETEKIKCDANRFWLAITICVCWEAFQCIVSPLVIMHIITARYLNVWRWQLLEIRGTNIVHWLYWHASDVQLLLSNLNALHVGKCAAIPIQIAHVTVSHWASMPKRHSKYKHSWNTESDKVQSSSEMPEMNAVPWAMSGVKCATVISHVAYPPSRHANLFANTTNCKLSLFETWLWAVNRFQPFVLSVECYCSTDSERW